MRGEEHPMLYVMDNCPDFIRTIPALQHDPDKPEDLDTTAEDHAADEARYGCMSRPWVPMSAIAPKPKPKPGQVWIGPPEIETGSKRTRI
jgi:hypothetical protein